MARHDFGVTKEATIVGKPANRPTWPWPGEYTVALKEGITSPTEGRERRVPEGLHRLGRGAARARGRGQGRACAVHRAPQARRHAQGREGHLGDPHQGGRAALRRARRFSDDPGEAAANYYVLKLMGYPDVKVLVS